jgi:hypothetical protein
VVISVQIIFESLGVDELTQKFLDLFKNSLKWDTKRLEQGLKNHKYFKLCSTKEEKNKNNQEENETNLKSGIP